MESALICAFLLPSEYRLTCDLMLTSRDPGVWVLTFAVLVYADPGHTLISLLLCTGRIVVQTSPISQQKISEFGGGGDIINGTGPSACWVNALLLTHPQPLKESYMVPAGLCDPVVSTSVAFEIQRNTCRIGVESH